MEILELLDHRILIHYMLVLAAVVLVVLHNNLAQQMLLVLEELEDNSPDSLELIYPQVLLLVSS